MSAEYNYAGYKKKMKGLAGIDMNPQGCPQRKPPTRYQLELVDSYMKMLLDAGVDWVYKIEPIRTGQYKLIGREANVAINSMRTLGERLGLCEPTEWIYTNLCKNKATGKRIKYRTTTHFASPVGYELIGELKRELVPKKSRG